MKKTLWTLNIDNYEPEICALTYPLLWAYAKKIGANFKVISKRQFPDLPVPMEKLQIFRLGQRNDWNVFVDADALIHPDMFDVTEVLPLDTVAHFGSDFAATRWKYDRHFRRDGRHIGSCNWFAVASKCCIDLWSPLDISTEQAISNIHPTEVEQREVGITPEHLLDDYTLSRNIAKFGLKFDTVTEINRRRGDKFEYFWHSHLLKPAAKLAKIQAKLAEWGLDKTLGHRQAESAIYDAL